MREWWARTLLVLHAPGAVFAALRDGDDDEDAADRAEPVLAIVLLAGVACVLTTRAAGGLLDDPQYDALLVTVWAFLAGTLYGAAGYWLLGALLHAGLRALGSEGTYRRARHVLAFAAVPLALSLGVAALEIAVYRGDLFRSGGADAGADAAVFTGLTLALAAWSVALLVAGVRVVEGWSWPRAAAAVGAAAALPLLLGLAVAVR